MTRREGALALSAVLLGVLAVAGPHVGNPPGHAEFIDNRAWHALPNAGDVLSNIPFLVAGVAGLAMLGRLPVRAVTNMERAMAALFFVGLVLTAACSSWFHLHPDDARLAVDRTGMAVAFAGLLGLAAATHVGERAAAITGLALLLAAPWAIGAATSGEVLPWAVLQFGGMVAIGAMACLAPLPGALRVHWLGLIAIYAVAKLAETNDAAVFAWTGHVVSGHSVKHVVAACAAYPVLTALRARRSVENGGRDQRRVPA